MLMKVTVTRRPCWGHTNRDWDGFHNRKDSKDSSCDTETNGVCTKLCHQYIKWWNGEGTTVQIMQWFFMQLCSSTGITQTSAGSKYPWQCFPLYPGKHLEQLCHHGQSSAVGNEPGSTYQTFRKSRVSNQPSTAPIGIDTHTATKQVKPF